MQNTFFIRLGMTPETQVSWLAVGEGAGAGPSTGELSEAAIRAQGARVVVLAPAAPMVTLEAELPPLQGAKLRQALPYALEEQFAEEVENLHFAIGSRNSEGRLPVVALEREMMERWQALFSEADLRPHMVLNESLSLPWQEGEWSLLLQDDDVALLRTNVYSGYAIPEGELGVWLELAWLGEETHPATIRLYDARSEDGGSPWRDVFADVEVIEEKVDSALKLFSQAEPERGINLLQGDFSRREQLGKIWRPWRATAALFGAWLVLQSAVAIGSYMSLSAEDERLYEDMKQLYLDSFPDARNVPDPRGQMETKLKELQGGGGGSAFVALLAASGPVLKDIDGLEVSNLRYKQGELELELQLKDLPSLDRLKEALQNNKLAVDIRSASTRENRVESRIALKEGGA